MSPSALAALQPRLRTWVWPCLAACLALIASPHCAAASSPLPAPSALERCVATSSQPSPPRALAMARIAQAEHVAWGGARLDAEGRLIRSGAAEAEESGVLARPAPWQRVIRYWSAVDDAEQARWPSAVRFGAARAAQRELLEQALQMSSADLLQGLGVGQGLGLQSDERRAIAVALARVAVIDTPWSAAFVSWVAREAGLRPGEFSFSEAHADYAADAWHTRMQESAGAPSTGAMRACDLRTTTPRVGDLVCHARAASRDLVTVDELGEALERRRATGSGLPMHCDVVVQVDDGGFDTIGGNVLDSVTGRRLAFAPGTRLLDASYQPGCSGCTDRHMSTAPWVLLLQWR